MLVASLLTKEDKEVEVDGLDDDEAEFAEAVDEATAESGNDIASSSPMLDAALLCCICSITTACSSIASVTSSLSMSSPSDADGRFDCDVCEVCDTK